VSRALVHHLRQPVAVHRVDRVVLVQREARVVLVAVREADAVGRLARRDHDLAHAERGRRLDHVVRAHHVDAEGLGVRLDHVARDRAEVDDRVGRTAPAGFLEAGHVEVAGHRVRDLPAVAEVRDQRVDAGVVERPQVEVQDFVALAQQVGHHVLPCLAAAAGEDDALAHGVSRILYRA